MKRYTGFTLIELIITVAIAAIVLAIGIPSFKETILQNRLTTYTNQLIGAINLARSEAIKRGVRVTPCPSNGADCEAIGYEKGWIVFTDPNNNAKLDTVNGETIIRIFEKMPDGMTLTGNGNVDTYISYTGDGVSRLEWRCVSIRYANSARTARLAKSYSAVLGAYGWKPIQPVSVAHHNLAHICSPAIIHFMTSTFPGLTRFVC